MPNILIDEATIAETNKALAAESIPVVLGLDVIETIVQLINPVAQKHPYVCMLKNTIEATRNPQPWQWSERSSLTSLLIQLLEQAPEDERGPILSDVRDHLFGPNEEELTGVS